MKISNKLIIITLTATLFATQLSKAQSESYGTWTSVGVEKDFGKWNVGAETELRTIYFARLIDRWSLGVNADYSIIKQLKIGIGYQYMKALDFKLDDDGYLIANYYTKNYFDRHRFNASATGKIKWNDFTFSLRERAQITIKENRIITSDGTVDDYNVNPAWVWRNKGQISYNIPKCKITPAFSVETFFDLNNPDGNSFNNFRYLLSFDYKLNKRNTIELYGVLNSALNSEDSYGKYILGISYNYSF